MPFDCPPWPPTWPEIQASVDRALRSGQWGQYRSQLGADLEIRLAGLAAASQCHLCCSGTAAMELALRCLRVGPGSEVILAAFDYPGNFRTIELLGATPVLVDVADQSTCIDPTDLEAAASDEVVAVVASHLYGRAADVDQLRAQCDKHGWALIEDACQCPGMMIDGKPVGSFGDLATFSFGGSKTLSAGTGGALLINADRVAARLPALVDRPSDVYPLSALQAAVIHPQLDRLAELRQQRSATVREIESTAAAKLPHWEWISQTQPAVEADYYKIGWMASSPESRAEIVTAATTAGLPIGEAFRSMSGASKRRCRKPVETPRADELGARAFVMDHRALLVDSDDHRAELLRTLEELHG